MNFCQQIKILIKISTFYLQVQFQQLNLTMFPQDEKIKNQNSSNFYNMQSQFSFSNYSSASIQELSQNSIQIQKGQFRKNSLSLQQQLQVYQILFKKISQFQNETSDLICYQDKIQISSTLLNQIIQLRNSLSLLRTQFNQTCTIIKNFNEKSNCNINQSIKDLKQNKKISEKQVQKWKDNYYKYIAQRHLKILSMLQQANSDIFPKYFNLKFYQNQQRQNLLQISMEKTIKMPIFYCKQNYQVSHKFYKGFNQKIKHKFIKQICQSLAQIQKLRLSNNDVTTKNIVYSIRDNRFKILDYDIAMLCGDLQKDYYNYTIIQSLDYFRIEDIEKKLQKQYSLSDEYIDEAICLNSSFQRKMNLFSLQDILFIKESFQNFRIFMKKNCGKIDIFMFSYLLVSIFFNQNTFQDLQSLIDKVISIDDQKYFQTLRKLFLPILSPFLEDICQILRSKSQQRLTSIQLYQKLLQSNSRLLLQQIQQKQIQHKIQIKNYTQEQSQIPLPPFNHNPRILQLLLEAMSESQNTHAEFSEQSQSNGSQISKIKSEYGNDQLQPEDCQLKDLINQINSRDNIYLQQCETSIKNILCKYTILQKHLKLFYLLQSRQKVVLTQIKIYILQQNLEQKQKCQIKSLLQVWKRQIQRFLYTRYKLQIKNFNHSYIYRFLCCNYYIKKIIRQIYEKYFSIVWQNSSEDKKNVSEIKVFKNLNNNKTAIRQQGVFFLFQKELQRQAKTIQSKQCFITQKYLKLYWRFRLNYQKNNQLLPFKCKHHKLKLSSLVLKSQINKKIWKKINSIIYNIIK